MAAQQPPCTHSLTCMRSRLSAQSHRPSRLVVYRKIVVVCLVCLFSLHVMPPLPTTTTAPQPHCTHSPTCMLSRLSAQSHRPSFCLVYRQVSSSVVSVLSVGKSSLPSVKIHQLPLNGSLGVRTLLVSQKRRELHSAGVM